MNKRPLADRFWEKVAIGSEFECWEFLGTRHGCGYGLIKAGGKLRWLRAHRVSFAIANGLDPRALSSEIHIRHTCDNRPCVNPNHLLPGTNAENSQDRVDRGRSRTQFSWADGKCSNGHDVDDPANVLILTSGKRHCRTCNHLRQVRYKASLKARRLTPNSQQPTQGDN